MTTFSSNIKLIILTWLMFALSAGNCKRDTIGVTLNCTIAYASSYNKSIYDVNPTNTPIISSCPEGYQNASIVKKCERLVNDERPFDSEIFNPITNNVTFVTYWNKYCASCNNDTLPRPLYWTLWKDYNDELWCEKLAPRIQRSETDDIPELIKIFVNQGGAKLISTFTDKRELACSTEGNWPILLMRESLSCLLDNFRLAQATRLLPCQYVEKTGKICTTMRLYLTKAYTYGFTNGKEIDYNETLSDVEFASDQYSVETNYDGIFYICEKTATIYGTGYTAKIIISIISLIFIIAYLGINLNKRYFQNMVNRMLYAYMIGLILIGAILLFAYLSYSALCVAFYLAKLLYFYHFFWTTLIFLEYCLKYHSKCDEYFTNENNAFSSRRKNYSFYIYSVLGLVVPLALTFTYYYGVLVIDENYKEDISQISPLRTRLSLSEYRCPVVPDHSGVPCTPYRDSGAKSYKNSVENFLSPSFYFFIPVLFVIISGFGLSHFTGWCSDNEGPIETTKRDHMIVLIKMGLIMGIHWILFKIYTNNEKDYSSTTAGLSLDTICQFSIDFHGVIVFFVFGIGNCMNKFGYEFKTVSQQDDNRDASKRPQSYQLSSPSNPTQKE